MIRNYRHGLTLVVITTLLLMAPAAALAGTAGAAQDEEDQEDTYTPGERLGGVVAAQQAELDGEMDERTFDVRVTNASDDNETAAVVSEELEDVEAKLEELDDRLERLEQARENGSISKGEYAAKAAAAEASRASLERLTDRANETASGLPEKTLQENGINTTAIKTLKNRASNLSGQEVATIARSIAGNNVGKGLGPENRPEDVPRNGSDDNRERGPPEETGNDTEDTERGPPADKGPDSKTKGASSDNGPGDDNTDDGSDSTDDGSDSTDDGSDSTDDGTDAGSGGSQGGY